MARYTFGGGAADWVGSTYALGGIFLWQTRHTITTFWDAPTGGTQYTDLRLGGSAVTSIETTAEGFIPLFDGPDGVQSLWADDGISGKRVRLVSPKGVKGDTGPAYPSVWVVDDVATEGIPLSAIPNQHFLLDMATGDFFQITQT